MSDSNPSSGLAIRPSVSKFAIGSELLIHQGEISLQANGVVQSELGTVYMSMQGSPDVIVDIPKPRSRPSFWSEVFVGIPGCETLAPAKPLSMSAERVGDSVVFGPAKLSLKGRLTIRSQPDQTFGRLKFHLRNFIPYFGSRIFAVGLEEGPWRGRCIFSFGGWVVTLDGLTNALDLDHQRSRGAGLTHVGSVEKEDGKLFSSDEADEIITFLGLVFTFASGSGCNCLLPCGFHPDVGQVARWISPEIALGESWTTTWFWEDEPDECFQFCGGLWRLWRDVSKRDWVSKSVTMYADCNRDVSGVDVELAKSQTILEMLAWEIAQGENELISLRGFENLNAADKIRLALVWAQVPAAIPKMSRGLDSAIEELKDGNSGPLDGPYVLTTIRNAVIHPTRAKRDRHKNLSEIAKIEAWQLSQDYVTLLILRLSGYRGKYVPRVRLSNVLERAFRVPWIRD